MIGREQRILNGNEVNNEKCPEPSAYTYEKAAMYIGVWLWAKRGSAAWRSAVAMQM
jgi:hypothetical protein